VEAQQSWRSLVRFGGGRRTHVADGDGEGGGEEKGEAAVKASFYSQGGEKGSCADDAGLYDSTRWQAAVAHVGDEGA
jgi:hypothetical protein